MPVTNTANMMPDDFELAKMFPIPPHREAYAARLMHDLAEIDARRKATPRIVIWAERMMLRWMDRYG